MWVWLVHVQKSHDGGCHNVTQVLDHGRQVGGAHGILQLSSHLLALLDLDLEGFHAVVLSQSRFLVG